MMFIFKKLKISTKLIISSVVFLVPVSVMLGLLINDTSIWIDRSRKEQYGIACIRHIEYLFNSIPDHLRISLGYETSDRESIEQDIMGILDSLAADINKYKNVLEFTDDKLAEHNLDHIKIDNIKAEWNRIRLMSREDTDTDAVLNAYLDFIQIVRDMIRYIGDTSTLIIDIELSSSYFADVALNIIPETQVRIVRIGNLIRSANRRLALQTRARRLSTDMSIQNMAEEDKRELALYTTLLRDSDHLRITTSFNTAMMETRNSVGDQMITPKLRSQWEWYNTSMSNFLKSLELIAAGERSITFESISESGIVINNHTCDFALAVLDQLDQMIEHRISVFRRYTLGSLLFVIIMVLFAFFVVIFSMVDISRSVKQLKTLFTCLRNNDLSLTLEVRSQDEFGELIAAFNGFIGSLRSVFNSFRQSSTLVSTSVYDLSASAREITTTANEQSASVSEIVSTMESSKQLSEQMATKTEEVADIAQQTQELSEKGAELRDANQGMMQEIRDQNTRIINEIKNLTDMIGRINDAIKIIDGIADQTKLIAFNASLEASSSGESGARFSVVASEIRRFADNVVDSTKDIRLKIEAVQSASQSLINAAYSGAQQIDRGYDRMTQQKTVFEDIVENAQNVATRSQQISNLSKQQEYASAQIFETLKEISAGVRQFVIATASTSKIADNLNEMSTGLQHATEKYRTK
ncbi:MAG: methyl-accepting chemotaxis protein [Treponema sp.]|jgi:methyl-accepting chemotaxis protein|nr:methyl-accepting chemotaxis protein [Treponema sp.]